jgi:hypothetical protein
MLQIWSPCRLKYLQIYRRLQVVKRKNLQLSTSPNMDFDSEQEKLSVMQIVIHFFASS